MVRFPAIPQAIVFDLDGVLFDTEALYRDALLGAAACAPSAPPLAPSPQAPPAPAAAPVAPAPSAEVTAPPAPAPAAGESSAIPADAVKTTSGLITKITTPGTGTIRATATRAFQSDLAQCPPRFYTVAAF